MFLSSCKVCLKPSWNPIQLPIWQYHFPWTSSRRLLELFLTNFSIHLPWNISLLILRSKNIPSISVAVYPRKLISDIAEYLPTKLESGLPRPAEAAARSSRAAAAGSLRGASDPVPCLHTLLVYPMTSNHSPRGCESMRPKMGQPESIPLYIHSLLYLPWIRYGFSNLFVGLGRPQLNFAVKSYDSDCFRNCFSSIF